MQRELDRKSGNESGNKIKRTGGRTAAKRRGKRASQSANISTIPEPDNVKQTAGRTTGALEAVDQGTEQKSLPGEGTSKTRTRNRRRRKLKVAQAEPGEADGLVVNQTTHEVPEPPAQMHEQEITTHNDIVPSASLLNRNRNKKRGFLHQMHEQTSEHIRFDTSGPTVNTQNLKPSGGTAIITSVDLDPIGSKLQRRKEKTYPVQIAPRILAVNQPIMENDVEDLDGNAGVDWEPHDETYASTDMHAIAAVDSADMDEIIDYESCEAVNFTTNLPQALDVLAIKTLVLSATYTPEISDWREVVVKDIDIVDGTITVEHLGLTDKALREGGRFELDAHNQDDDWVEAEPYNDDDAIVTLLKSDIVDMRRIR